MKCVMQVHSLIRARQAQQAQLGTYRSNRKMDVQQLKGKHCMGCNLMHLCCSVMLHNVFRLHITGQAFMGTITH